MQCTLLLENLCVQTQRRVTYRERGDGQYQTLTLTHSLTHSHIPENTPAQPHALSLSFTACGALSVPRKKRGSPLVAAFTSATRCLSRYTHTHTYVVSSEKSSTYKSHFNAVVTTNTPPLTHAHTSPSHARLSHSLTHSLTLSTGKQNRCGRSRPPSNK